MQSAVKKATLAPLIQNAEALAGKDSLWRVTSCGARGPTEAKPAGMAGWAAIARALLQDLPETGAGLSEKHQPGQLQALLNGACPDASEKLCLTLRKCIKFWLKSRIGLRSGKTYQGKFGETRKINGRRPHRGGRSVPDAPISAHLRTGKQPCFSPRPSLGTAPCPLESTRNPRSRRSPARRRRR